MKKALKSLSNFFMDHLAAFIWMGVALLCAIFIVCGTKAENGSITLDGSDAKIEEYTEKFIEDANEAMLRLMEKDAPTDEETIKANYDEEVGLGFYTTIDAVIGRRLPDGNNDGGRGWQCSKYTAYLATGKREYSSTHPDYGPVNGKDVAAWLVKNYGFKYVDKPVKGASGSGGFNTQYGHTAMYLYSTGSNTAMVNDANYTPLKVATHNMNISGWVWVVPGSYNPQPAPTPTPKPTPVSYDSYTVRKGDTLGDIARNMGWYTGGKLFGDDG
jgi:LysM repeat protein